MNLAGVGKPAGSVECDRRNVAGGNHSGVEARAGCRVLIVVGIDEGHRLAEVNRELTGNEPAGIITDDANLDGTLRHLAGDLHLLFVSVLLAGFAIISVAGAAVIVVISATTTTGVVVIVAVLRKRGRTGVFRRGLARREIGGRVNRLHGPP